MIEAHPQTGHKVALMDNYYGQYPSILIEAGKSNARIDASHIWLIEVCAGAGTYLSSDHPDGYVDGCALRACAKAREIQKNHENVIIHVVLVESDADHCAALSGLIVEYTEARGREKVDVRIVHSRFEDCVDQVLDLTRKPDGSFYHSLWFLDPDGVTEIPHKAVNVIAAVGRGPEIIINLTVAGLSRLRDAAIVKPGIAPHRSLAGDQRAMATFFGSESWRNIETTGSREINFVRLAQAYADRFPTFKTQLHKLRSNGDEIRIFVHLSHSDKALQAFDRTYKISQRIGLAQGAKMVEREKAAYANELHKEMLGQTVATEECYVAISGRLNRSQVATVLRYADVKGFGTFDEGNRMMHWFVERRTSDRRMLSVPAKVSIPQLDLFERI